MSAPPVIEIKNRDDGPAAECLCRTTKTSADCNAAFTQEAWKTRSKALLTLQILRAQIAFAPGTYRLIVRHEKDSKTETFFSARPMVIEDASDVTDLAAPPSSRGWHVPPPLSLFPPFPLSDFILLMTLPTILAQALPQTGFHIPDVVWSGMIGSGLTILGVLLTTWDNNRRLKKQLIHDRSLKEEDRLAAYERESCSKLINSIHEIEDCLNNAESISNEELSKRRKEFLQHTYLVEISASRLTSELSQELREEWQNINNAINDEVRELIESYSQMIQYLDLSNSAGDAYNDLLTKKRKDLSSVSDESLISHKKLHESVRNTFDKFDEEYFEKKRKFHEFVNEKAAHAMKLKRLLIKSIRKDLGLPDDY